MSNDSDESRRRPKTTRFTDHRRAFLSPFWRALGDIATPTVAETYTPSQVAAVLGWDVMDAVRVVPMTDEEATGSVPQLRTGTGERRLRRVE